MHLGSSGILQSNSNQGFGCSSVGLYQMPALRKGGNMVSHVSEYMRNRQKYCKTTEEDLLRKVARFLHNR